MLDTILNLFFIFLFFIFQPISTAARERCYKQIAAAVAKYREIKENINEGLKFYVTLQVRYLHISESKYSPEKMTTCEINLYLNNHE